MILRHARWFVFAVLPLAYVGCSSGPGETDKPDEDEKKEFVLGDLVEKFEPPTLEELDAKVEWQDSPVLSSMELLRVHQAEQGPPIATVEEALSLSNDSAEANTKILSALGRLPADDSAVDFEAKLLRHTSGDVKSTNPLMISSTAEFDVIGLTGMGLFGFDWEFNQYAVQESVKSWKSSKDGLYEKVVMRDDLTWSDDKPFTAHDVEFSYKVIMSSTVPVPAQRSGTDQLKYVKAYDDYTLVYFHKEALATNVGNLNFSIIPKHVFETTIAADPTLEKSEEHVARDRDPVTSGMYVITKRVRGQEIVLKRRESYYMHDGKQVREKPHFETIRFKVIQDPTTSLLAFKKGDVEEIILTPEQWQTQTNDSDFYKNNTKARETEWVTFSFFWNCKTVYFEDPKVRKAMSYAFDHATMLRDHRFGLDEAGTGIFHPTSKWAPDNPPKPYQQNLDKAEELLAEAGWEDHDGDGVLDKEYKGKFVPFEFTILTSNRQDRIDICDLLRENLDRIGIVCKVQPMEFTVLQDRNRTHKFQATFGGWGTGIDPDTSENLWTTKAIDNGRNYGQYSNPKIDALFEKGKRELDPEKRIKIYQEIHQVLWEDQPYTWLFFRNAYYGFNKSLRGYNFSPRGPYNYGPGFDAIYKPAK
jgi:peptide/nickel transport system substrate-binding protein